MITGISPLGGGLILLCILITTKNTKSVMKVLLLSASSFWLFCFCALATGNPRLELNGILDFAGQRRFSIHDRSSGTSFWLVEGRERYGMQIEEWAPDQSALTLSVSGKQVTLRFKEERIKHLELRTREEILSDPTVVERNRKLSDATEFMMLDASVGYQIAVERRRKVELAARERAKRASR